MSDSSTSLRFPSETPVLKLLPGVRSFLAESQRRVIEHCRRLLAAPDLAEDHRPRLTRLAGLAEVELQRLQA